MGSQETKTEERLQIGGRRYAQEALGEAQNLYNTMGDLPSTYVPISQQRQEGLGQAYNLAMGGAQVQPAAIDEYSRTIGGEYLSPESNPYLDEMVRRSVLQSQGAVNRGTGRYGSGAWANAMADATQGTAARLYSGAYEAERDRMARAMALAPAMSNLEYAPSSELERIGAAYEADEAAQLGEDMRQFMWPYERLGMYERSIAGSPLTREYYGTKRTEQPFNWLGAGATAVGALGGQFAQGGAFAPGGAFGPPSSWEWLQGLRSPGMPPTAPNRYQSPGPYYAGYSAPVPDYYGYFGT